MKIAVIGGGAAGMMAAITAAENGAEVIIYERNDRVGKKILATGNGKCNFSNADMGPDYFYGNDKDRAWKVIEKFDEKKTVSFFENAGMLVKNRNGGLYPTSGQASTVLDILRQKLAAKNIKVITEQLVKEVQKEKNSEKIAVITKGTKAVYDRVIIACGGAAAPKTGSDGNGYRLAKNLGHSLVDTVPALVQLKCTEEYLKAISGVRTDAALELLIDGKKAGCESGELQFTDYGISGIVVFQLSRTAAYALKQKKKVTMYINCLPEFTDETYKSFIKERKQRLKDADTVETFFTGMLNKKLMLLFIKLAGLKTTDSYKKASQEKIDKVFALCRCLPMHVCDTNSFDNAQVTAGGIPLAEVSDNLESRKVKNVYFAGEILDVDGVCGGYNLQWAWTSGYVAGEAATKKQ
ncbi:MAG: aminoacetone oxidase family FAD-binding enzyme [Lachnospiraceae bacterium]|nr:aminoacetone oxidase family FAD-binding enzyme [Lachnospiraceae bacterium]